MSISGIRRSIEKLIEIIEENNLDEIEVSRWWGLTKIKVVRRSFSTSVPVQKKVESQVEVLEPVEEVPEETVPHGLYEMRSPMVGTFYHSPSPGAEPYVKEKDMVSPGQIVCIIEAMKIMNPIESDVKGEIVEILVENAQPVEFHQRLFLIRPTA